MPRFPQTIARVGAGLVSMTMLTWLFWNGVSFATIEPEPLFMFLVSAATWIMTEIKTSEEVQLRISSPNDVRVSREFLELHRNDFRNLLKDSDLFQFISSQIYSTAGELLNRREVGSLEFQNKILDNLLSEFLIELDKLTSHVALNTTPEKIGASFKTGFKPTTIVPEEEYQRLIGLSKEANVLADEAWKKLENLVFEIKKVIPESLD